MAKANPSKKTSTTKRARAANKRGNRALSDARILRAAVSEVERGGLERLSMRTLAARMNTGAMSIYHYFSSKDELLDAMVEWVAAKIDLGSEELHWRAAVSTIALSAHRTLMAHGWVIGIWSKRKLGPARLAFMESILAALRRGGFSVELACDAYHAITVHVEGYTHHAVGFPLEAGDFPTAAADFLASVTEPDSIPFFVEHVQHHVDHPGSGTGQFELMLGMILDGFEARLSSQESA